MGDTSIQWTDKTWSPLRVRVKSDASEIAEAKGYASLIQIAAKMAGHVGPHCERVSKGCDHCYSDTNNGRCLPANGTGLPFDRRSRDLIDPFVDENILEQPLRWRKPQRIFVENQSDLFGDWITDEMLDRVFTVMCFAHNHTYQILTKRPSRMKAYMDSAMPRVAKLLEKDHGSYPDGINWPPRWIWLGVSVENQATADERIPLLLGTPAAIRFVSYEPALGPVDFKRFSETGLECNYCQGWRGTEETAKPDGNEEDPGFLCPKCGEACAHLPLDEELNWVIVGGESGPGARPFDIEWASETVRQCEFASIPVFVKQIGAKPFHSLDSQYPRVPLEDKKGGDIGEWPIRLRVRQFPEVVHA